MQGPATLHLVLLLVLALVCSIQGVSYIYKTRAPPPPPLPPAKLHYGPKPPPPATFYQRFPKLPPSAGYHHLHAHEHLHAHHLRPASIHHHIPHRQPIRIPLRPLPYIAKPTPPPLPLPTSWKTLSSFRAPVLKETFHASPQTDYTPSDHYIKHDDDKGPIHTIPAPNLGPADKPPTQSLYHTFSSPAAEYTKPNPSADLAAVLNHASQVVSQPLSSSHGYQVTEDPSLHQYNSPGPSYFAPDPDPSVPTLKIPETTDPHSQPSNGQAPIDLVLQQQAEQQQLQAEQQQLQAAQLLQQQQLQAQLQLQQLQQHYLQQQHQQPINVQQVAAGSGAATTSNTLTSQDLYNLFNGFTQQQQQQLLSQQYFTQPQLDYQQIYNSALLYQQPQQHQPLYQQEAQISQQEFHPQFQTFNYDEQTQQGAHGSDSFPSASISIEVKRAVSKPSASTGYNDNSLKGANSVTSSLANLNLLQKSNIAVRSDTNSYHDKEDTKILADESESEGVISNHVDYDEKLTQPKETQSESSAINSNYYTTLPNKKAAETLATLAAAGNINNQIMKGVTANKEETEVHVNNYSEENEDVEEEEEEEEGDNNKDKKEEETKPDKNEKDNNVQTNGHVYEESYYNKSNKQENISDDKDYDDTEMEYMQEEEPEQSNLSTSQSTLFNAHSQSQVPYGYKLRPKRV